jgi:uncharacterized protein YdiU (UPF0061 family)
MKRLEKFFRITPRFSIFIRSQLLDLPQRSMSKFIGLASPTRKLEEIPAQINSVFKFLKAEAVEAKTGDQNFPRQVKGVHFTPVLPEPVPRPELVAFSSSCALEELGLSAEESQRPEFITLFAGNFTQSKDKEDTSGLQKLQRPYCTVYGCHSHGQWFGQLGDGRAMILGETHLSHSIDQYYSDGLRDLQLKGAGRSPYSRGFDGRAVLRSSVREMLGTLLINYRASTFSKVVSTIV